VAETFLYLPFFTVIDEQIFVVHGGLSKYTDITLQELDTLPFPVEPMELRTPAKTNPDIQKQLHLIECALWSDPVENMEGTRPSSRRVGVQWGIDVTKQFLQTNKMSMVVRSHEQKDEGYEWAHDNLVLTLFSASNYNGLYNNKGAVATFTAAAPLTPTLHKYYAVVLAQSATTNTCQQETLEKLRNRIYVNRHTLTLQFEQYDKSLNGTVSVDDFIEIMKKVISPQLRWDLLWKYFTSQNKQGRIEYIPFLDRYNVTNEDLLWDQWADFVDERISTYLLENIGSVEAAFDFFDTDGNKQISYSEFSETLSSFDLKLSSEQICDLYRSIDENQDGHIDWKEFMNWLHRFQAIKQDKALWSTQEANIFSHSFSHKANPTVRATSNTTRSS